MSTEDLCEACESHIAAVTVTGFKVRIREKRRMTVLETIAKLANSREGQMMLDGPRKATVYQLLLQLSSARRQSNASWRVKMVD